MADSASWLRPFARSRGTAIPTSNPGQHDNTNPAAATSRAPAPAMEPSSSSTLSPTRVRGGPAVRRVKSLLSLGGSGSSNKGRIHVPAPAPIWMLPLTELELDGDGDLYGAGVSGSRGSRCGGSLTTWHNPNLMQMVETLRAVMIAKRNALEGIPVCYNSHVLALIEGFAHVTEQLREKDEAFAELKNIREKELEQFRSVSEEWVRREEGYKAEVKRLELVLAKESKDGVASVAMARQGSLVDRAGSKRFRARVERISKSVEHDVVGTDARRQLGAQPVDFEEATTSYKVSGSIPQILDSNRDVLMSRLLVRQAIEEKRLLGEQGQMLPAPARARHAQHQRALEVHRSTMKSRKEFSSSSASSSPTDGQVGPERGLQNSQDIDCADTPNDKHSLTKPHRAVSFELGPPRSPDSEGSGKPLST
ncbi:hypothetical protein N656DRAFT_599541 [Canariomyces notabilis]|uniref:Uncharacterized protein n=1 Tax=Canariomyces notabilis TaxID=2074819 RepID=A0AAN6TG33_9PEZI|nr:hypothetical protein N656DRAFT_599541 [Canariomyces arenarius]